MKIKIVFFGALLLSACSKPVLDEEGRSMIAILAKPIAQQCKAEGIIIKDQRGINQQIAKYNKAEGAGLAQEMQTIMLGPDKKMVEKLTGVAMPTCAEFKKEIQELPHMYPYLTIRS